MLLLSKTCNYGIRAALYVASNKDQQFVPIRQIAEKLNISFHFLTKILQTLTQKQIMNSYRGPNGGVSLAKSPDAITIFDIIEAIDGVKIFEECILGLPGCGNNKPCPFHDNWRAVREDLKNTFMNSTLDDLSNRINDFGLRITEP
jgi:Rrf2 family iron-sulfur cluster assembly transcriptional regulator